MNSQIMTASRVETVGLSPGAAPLQPRYRKDKKGIELVTAAAKTS